MDTFILPGAISDAGVGLTAVSSIAITPPILIASAVILYYAVKREDPSPPEPGPTPSGHGNIYIGLLVVLGILAAARWAS